MKRLLAVLALLGLAACENPPTSDKPLVQAGRQQPRPGLWVILAENCPAPTSPDVGTWPDCSMPVWVGPGRVTFVLLAPIPSGLVISDGSPAIVQLETTDDGPPRTPPFIQPMGAGEMRQARKAEYAYLAAQPEGAPPFVRARVWSIRCPPAEKPAAPANADDDDDRDEDDAAEEAGGKPAPTEGKPGMESCKVDDAAVLRKMAADTVKTSPGYRALWIR